MGTFESITYYLRVYRKYIGRRLYVVFVLTGLAALVEGLGITLLLPLLRVTETGGSQEVSGTVQEALYAALTWLGIEESIVGILLLIGFVFLGKGLLKFAEAGYRGYLQARLLRELKGKLFRRYGSMDYEYYSSTNTGHLVNVINGRVNGFYASFEHFARFGSKVITGISYFAVAFALAWQFALMAVVMGGIVLFFFKYLNAYVRRLSGQASLEQSQLNKLLMQALHSFKYIASTDQVRYLTDGVFESIRRLTGYRLRQKVAKAFTSAIREPLSVFFIILVVVIQVTVLDAPLAPIFVAIVLFHRGMQTMVGIQKRWQDTMNKIGSLEMVVDEFQALERHSEPNGDTEIGPLQEGIEVRNVSFAYDEEEEDVLHDLSVSIPANTTVALVGESGAGKSTLVDLLTLMLRPRKGEVYIDGVPGSEVERSSWRSQIGYVSQETAIFDDTVANNISLWKGDYTSDPDVRQKVEEAARRAYAHNFIMDLPDGYQTVVGDNGVRLSGGQCQRLFVARELYKQPNLLILDEATSDLDSASEQHIQDSIDALQGKVTVVTIAHRLSTVKNADQVYVLDEGRVIEEGSYHELRMRENGQFREMVEMQSL
ncbi:ATP-binding cassette domain-containing protein [Salinibacter ruber]|uniref:ATP-binding cassette domain-containing protein n=1 Tax=Salinibacter ruber TaxID=146919 RepID=UPI00161AABB9|nr:ABC-type multidrug transport system fused ATPase/permease subunit [Salinibacter ruber]